MVKDDSFDDQKKSSPSVQDRNHENFGFEKPK